MTDRTDPTVAGDDAQSDGAHASGAERASPWAAATDRVITRRTSSVGPSLSGRRRFFRRFRRQRPAIVALCFLVSLTTIALLAPVISPYEPNQQTLTRILERPSFDHWLGTDDVGRDVFSRLLYGGRLSLLAALQAVGVGVVLGVPPGLVAGFFGRWVDLVIMRITDAVMSFPPLILAISIVGVLGPNITNAMLAVGVIFAPRFLRLVRGAVLTVREETFIEASRAIGTPTPWVIRRHILPNVMSPLIVQISLASGFAMLAEASLSFLGLGAQPPQASWGSMLSRGVRHMTDAPWLIFAPGLMIALTVLAFNILGDGIRDSIGREIRRAD